MNARIDLILNEALGLSLDERTALTLALLESLEESADSSISDASRLEIKERQAALRTGTIEPISWAEARARLNAL